MPHPMLRDPEFYKLKPNEQVSLFSDADPDFKSLQMPEQMRFLLDAKKQYDPGYLSILQQHNINREAEAGLAGEKVAQTGRNWGAGMRAFGGIVGSSTPIAGPVVAGVSDIAAQGMELASGARQHYNPLSTATEASLAAIPMGTIAKRIPVLGKLKTAGLPSKAGQMIEGAIMGPAAVTATRLSEGELPTSGELGTSLIIGGATGRFMGKLARKEAALPEVATNRIIRALDIPTGAKDVAESMTNIKKALPIVHELNATRRGASGSIARINSLESLRDATVHAKQRLWNDHIRPVIDSSGLTGIRTDDVSSAIARHFDNIDIAQSPGVIRQATRKASAWTGMSYTAKELERKLQQKNAELESFYKKNNLDRGTVLRTAEGYKIKEVDALRDVLYKHLEQLGAPNIRELKHMYGSLDELEHLTALRTGKYRAMEAKIAGERFPKAHKAGQALRGLLPLYGRRGAGEAVEAGVELINTPDALISSAFRMMGKAQKHLPTLPPKFQPTAQYVGWQQPQGPIINVPQAGLNAPATSLSPMPRPPSSLSKRQP